MSDRAQFSEHVRQTVHVAVGAFALLLRYLSWWQAGILGLAALAFNAFVLPRLWGARIFRPGELQSAAGILYYPAAVCLLILLYRDRMDIVAAAWGVLAVGDGLATIVGRAAGGPVWPWNRRKTMAGSAALFLFGGLAGAALAWWSRPAVVPPAYVWFSLGAPFLAAFAAAAVETIPIRLDDNISVPLTAGGVLWAMSLVSQDGVADAYTAATRMLPLAAAANAAVAWAGHRARTVTTSGAVAGTVIGIVVAVTMGWSGWCLLLATFIAASMTSRMGLRRKALLGIAEERGGRRGAGNAIANTGVAAIAAFLAVTTYAAVPSAIAFVAALAAGGSDTIASEIGKAWGRRTYLVPTFRAVPAGASGGISLEGTAAGLAGALLLGGIGVALSIIPLWALLPVVAGATIGSLAESVLGATLEGPGILNNDVLNFLNTTVAALCSVTIGGWMR